MSYTVKLFKDEEQIAIYTFESDEASNIIEGESDSLSDWVIDALEAAETPDELLTDEEDDDEEDEE